MSLSGSLSLAPGELQLAYTQSENLTLAFPLLGSRRLRVGQLDLVPFLSSDANCSQIPSE
jgi:hypothetical protein